MKTSRHAVCLAAAFLLAATPAFATQQTFVENTFIGGGTEPSDEGLWAPNSFTAVQLTAPAAVPEPGTAALVLFAAGLLAIDRRRNRN